MIDAAEGVNAEGHGDSKKPIRAMILGDSMTQGAEGDWTWRYRLWDWCRDQSIDIKFVGPYEGTQETDSPSPPKPPSLYGTSDPPGEVRHHGTYAVGGSKDFDSHHFSVWGRQAAATQDLIKDVISAHPTDLLLVMLGFNDMGWFVSDAAGTLESMQNLVKHAREANPRLKFVLANVPQRTYMEGREDLPANTDKYNELLLKAVPEWTSKQSPIHVAKLRESYVAEDASYDGLHPNNLGDYQIAKAFSEALVEGFNLGKTPLSVPKHIPPRPLPTPSNLKVLESPGGVTATWDKVYGTYGYEIKTRQTGQEDFGDGVAHSNRWDSHWAGEGWVYDVQVRASYGNQAKSDWTPVRSATAHPKLASAPRNVVVKQTKTGIEVSWDPPTGPHTDSILQYSVLWRDKDVPSIFMGLAAFQKSPARIDELEKGHKYDIMMLTWNAAGEGWPGEAQEIRVGKPSKD